jgi:hypothetical protein
MPILARMTRLLLPWLVIGLAAAAAHAETAAAMAAAMPASLGTFARVGTMDYEARRPGLGHAVRYRAGATHADVFIYDLGEPGVPDGAGSGRVRAQHRQMLADIEQVYRQQGRRIAAQSLIDGVATGLGCTSFRFAAADGAEGYSLACLTGAGGQFVKIRVTGPADDASIAAMHGFAAGATAAVRAAAR